MDSCISSKFAFIGIPAMLNGSLQPARWRKFCGFRYRAKGKKFYKNMINNYLKYIFSRWKNFIF